MGYDYSICSQRLANAGLNPCVSTNDPKMYDHCADITSEPAYHSFCSGQAVYQPVQALGCKNCGTGELRFFKSSQIIDECSKLHNQDPNWNFHVCYCCCGCFADGTLIEVPEGQLEIRKINCGDKILSGLVETGGIKPVLTWKPAEIVFSTGSVAGEHPAMVHLLYSDKKEMIVTPDQVFMLSNGKLTTAGKLKPGEQLVDKYGNPVPVLSVSLGHYTGGVHHITTNVNFDGTIDNHLVVAGDVVCGDYTIQLYFGSLDESLKVDDHDTLEVIGSSAYLQSYKHLISEKGVFDFTGNEAGQHLNNESFTSYDHDELGIPEGAEKLFTVNQTVDILQNGTQFPVHVTIGLAAAQYLIKLFKGFYPDVQINLEWERKEPNIYAFKRFWGKRVVTVSGGLVRMKGLGMEGLALLIGHGIARFYGGNPKNTKGYSCTGTADFYSCSAISRKIWFGDQWMNLVLAGYNQVTSLFGLISEENGQGNPKDSCGEPSVKCRLQTMQSGIAGGNLPVCAGGAEKAQLKELQTE